MRVSAIAALAAAIFLAGASQSVAACALNAFAAFPVTIEGDRPTVEAKIDGKPARFLVDSGADFSFISPGAAAQFRLRLAPPPRDIVIWGVGGSASVQMAQIQSFSLSDIPVPHAQFLVGGSENGGDLAGLIGQNVLGIADVEYDLPDGMVRLFRTQGCGKADLAYWAKPPLTWGVVDLLPEDRGPRQTNGFVEVNGKRIQVTFDTGASESVMSMGAAKRVGLTPNSPGVVDGGPMGGVGRKYVPTWIAPVDAIDIGGERIEHTHIRFGDLQLGDSDMLLGADFFLSHRVYVANSQHKLYFTYSGGPVFNLTTQPKTASSPTEAAPAGAVVNEPSDADGFARRGAARLARRDFSGAIADYGKAMALEPKSAEHPLGRAFAEGESGDDKAAIGDLDKALSLDPSLWLARFTRAEMRLNSHEEAAALSDLDAADKLIAPESNERFSLGELYLEAWSPAEAQIQFDDWIRYHPDDHKLALALANRCFSRALQSLELDKAAGDCERSIHIDRGEMFAHVARGFLRLRRSDFDGAIGDFTAALEGDKSYALALWGRGLAETRKGQAAQAKADLAAAKAIDPKIEEKADHFGLGAPKS